MSANGQLEHSNEGMCDISNSYFSSVFTNETPFYVHSASFLQCHSCANDIAVLVFIFFSPLK